jgi:hypothetical protein
MGPTTPKKTCAKPQMAKSNNIVVVNWGKDSVHLPPTKKLKLDKPKEPFNPVEMIEIL